MNLSNYTYIMNKLKGGIMFWFWISWCA